MLQHAKQASKIEWYNVTAAENVIFGIPSEIAVVHIEMHIEHPKRISENVIVDMGMQIGYNKHFANGKMFPEILE